MKFELDTPFTVDEELDNELVTSWFETQVVKGRPHRARSGFHFSDANKPDIDAWGHKQFCARQCVLATAYECNEVVLNARTVITFELGWHIHMMLQDLMVNAGVSLAVEAKYYAEGWSMLFTPDQLLGYPSADDPSLWEYKGYHQEEFDRIVLSGKPPLDASRQLLAYMYMTGIHKGYTLVLCKGKSSLLENKYQRKLYQIWPVPYEPEKIVDLIEKLDRIKVAIEEFTASGTLPQRICTSSRDKRAKTCSSCEVCFAKPQDRELLRVTTNTCL